MLRADADGGRTGTVMLRADADGGRTGTVVLRADADGGRTGTVVLHAGAVGGRTGTVVLHAGAGWLPYRSVDRHGPGRAAPDLARRAPRAGAGGRLVGTVVLHAGAAGGRSGEVAGTDGFRTGGSCCVPVRLAVAPA
ncbi:hypothetical protein ACBR38_15920 [Streptomyces sp. MAD19A]|uniref:hypothetical protein n=1 Tax=Streptomyces sp. MAD19A TaxID=3242896 RepID=UPI0035299033